MERKERCDRCYWWVLEWPPSLVGECRRHPPKITGNTNAVQLDNGDVSSLCEYPATHADWFCGEFKPQEDAE